MSARETELRQEISNLAQQIVEIATKQNLYVTTAESCTGGMVAAAITDIAGSSAIFQQGLVTYSNESKVRQLRVPFETIKTYGAVSQQTAKAMAEGALSSARADIAVSITGIAGPGGGSEQKPVGTVWLGLATTTKPTETRHCLFEGNRAEVRLLSVKEALGMVLIQMTC